MRRLDEHIKVDSPVGAHLAHRAGKYTVTLLESAQETLHIAKCT